MQNDKPDARPTPSAFALEAGASTTTTSEAPIITGRATGAILLSQGKIATCDAVDFAKVSQHRWYARRGGSGLWYAARNFVIRRSGRGYHQQTMHEFITGRKGADHRDGDGLNNRRSNLRCANQFQNCANARRRIDNRTGFKGVTRGHRNKHRARIQVRRQIINLGSYARLEEAATAYGLAALLYFGDFARLV